LDYQQLITSNMYMRLGAKYERQKQKITNCWNGCHVWVNMVKPE
jgi:hypothetical protein